MDRWSWTEALQTPIEQLPDATITSEDSKVLSFGDAEVVGRHVDVTAPWSVIGGKWRDCKFRIDERTISKEKDAAGFRDATFEGCEFLSVGKSFGAVVLNSSSLNRCRFMGALGTVKIIRPQSPVHRCTFVTTSSLFEADKVRFERCDIRGQVGKWVTRDSSFIDCTWAPEILGSADLSGTRFDGSTIVVGAWVDRCANKETVYLQSARRVVDQWAELRAEYTGVRLYIILLLTLAFALPYVAKAWLLTLAADALRGQGLEIRWVPLWFALMFPHGTASAGTAILGAILLFYNAGPLWLTFRVASMREREEHLLATGFTAARPVLASRTILLPPPVLLVLWRWFPPRPLKIVPLWWTHRFMRVLWVISVATAVIRILWLLLDPVPIF